MERRDFFRSLAALLLTPSAFLLLPKCVEARPMTVANFLAPFGPVYDENTEWDFGSGPLLIGINGYSGNLLVLIDDVWISVSVKSTIFDPTRQRLQVRLNQVSGPVVFSYNPLASRISHNLS